MQLGFFCTQREIYKFPINYYGKHRCGSSLPIDYARERYDVRSRMVVYRGTCGMVDRLENNRIVESREKWTKGLVHSALRT